ncbi:response regulator [Acidobacteriota bacterium]
MNENYDLLVVEDEPVVLSAIRKIVESERLRMDEAMTVEIAVGKVSRNAYKLIVTDLMLPHASGLDLIKAVKEEFPNIPLVVITGYATLEKALQSFRMGSFDFIPKPFDTEAFLAVISRGLNYSRLMHDKGSEPLPFVPFSDTSSGDNGSPDVFCLGSHALVRLREDGSAIVGVGNTFPNMIDNLQRIEITNHVGELIQGKCCAQFITEDGRINTLWAPLSGMTEEYNEELDKNVHLIDTNPYDKGWIFRITPTNLEEELKHLTRCRMKLE